MGKKTQAENKNIKVTRDSKTGRFIGLAKDSSASEYVTMEDLWKLAPILKELADYDKRQ
jgi:hypothetical protein